MIIMSDKRYRRSNNLTKLIITGVLIVALGMVGGVSGALIVNHFSNSGAIVTTSSGTTAVKSDKDASAIAQKMSASVVAITTEEIQTNSFWYGDQVSSGAGSGVIMSANGYIITCAHVVEDANKIKVTTYDDKTYQAELIGSSTKNDIAVIKIDAKGLTAATFANTDNLVQGQTVYAVGNPEGTFSNSITSGILSALNRTIKISMDDSSQNQYPWGQYRQSSNVIELTVIQTDAAVSPGNSGGGLFNSAGELIGIVNAKSSSENSEGLGFAIYGNKALAVAKELINK